MRALVTGASGFIAANLLRGLLQEGHEVHCLVRRTSDLWRLAGLRKRLTLHMADLARAEEVEAVFQQARPEWLFHLATARAGAEDFSTFFQGNIVSAVNLIAACRKLPPARIVVHGSSLEYGHRSQPLCENMAATPTTLHGSTKLCSTLLFLQAHRSFHLPVTVLRLFSIYGPWEAPGRLLPKALLAGIDGRTLQLTPPGIRRDYVFVDDVVKASLLAIAEEAAIGEVINIGSGRQTSNETVIAQIGALTGNTLRISGYDYPWHQTDSDYWLADTRKCRELLGWIPPTSLADGLRSFLEWIRQNRQLPGYLSPCGGTGLGHL